MNTGRERFLRGLRVAWVAGVIFAVTRAALHAFVSAGEGVPVLGIDVHRFMQFFYVAAAPVFFPTVVALHGLFRSFPGLIGSADEVEAFAEAAVSGVWAIIICHFLERHRRRAGGSLGRKPGT